MPKVHVKAVSKAGFYRIGRKWENSGTEAEVTDEELKRLQADNALLVTVMGEGSAPPAAAPPGDGRAVVNSPGLTSPGAEKPIPTDDQVAGGKRR